MAALIDLDVFLKSGEVRLEEGEMKTPWPPFQGGSSFGHEGNHLDVLIGRDAALGFCRMKSCGI
jgi:hypothetical protein